MLCNTSTLWCGASSSSLYLFCLDRLVVDIYKKEGAKSYGFFYNVACSSSEKILLKSLSPISFFRPYSEHCIYSTVCMVTTLRVEHGMQSNSNKCNVHIYSTNMYLNIYHRMGLKRVYIHTYINRSTCKNTIFPRRTTRFFHTASSTRK